MALRAGLCRQAVHAGRAGADAGAGAVVLHRPRGAAAHRCLRPAPRRHRAVDRTARAVDHAAGAAGSRRARAAGLALH
ncbi:hypothetical protein DF186_22900, partial [Enterococcus hirae]